MALLWHSDLRNLNWLGFKQVCFSRRCGWRCCLVPLEISSVDGFQVSPTCATGERVPSLNRDSDPDFVSFPAHTRAPSQSREKEPAENK